MTSPIPWSCSAATICDGRSVGDRSNVPAAIVPSRFALMIAYWNAISLEISPCSASSCPMEVSVAPSSIVTVTRRCSSRDRRVGEDLGLVPAHEVLDEAVLDGAGVLLDPGHHSWGEEDVEADDDGRHEKRDRARDPGDEKERLDPTPSADRAFALLSQLADPRVSALLVLVRAGGSAHSVSSTTRPGRCRASRYCCRIRRAAAESSSPLPRSGRRPASASRCDASQLLSRSSSKTTSIPRRRETLAEGARLRCLRSLGAVHVERQPEHDPAHPLGGAQLTDEGQIVIEVAPLDRHPSKRHAGLRVGDGDADPALAVVEAEEPAHGAWASASTITTSTRASIVGTVVTQPGHSSTDAWPMSASSASASSTVAPATAPAPPPGR